MNSKAHEIPPAQAAQLQASGALLIDIREPVEREGGTPVDALGLAQAALPQQIDEIAPDRAQELVLICAKGQRSLVAVDTLRQMGYSHISSVAGGFHRWKAEGLPVADPALATLGANASERYARQLCLPQVGIRGQTRLQASRVAIVGAGGLGAPCALYLAAAGIGKITLIDDDHVERSNLHRQVIHTDDRVGVAKTESARQTLTALNPQVHIQTHMLRLRGDNVETLLAGHDLIIDGADNFPTRYLINAASQRLRTPMIYGAVERFSGQVSTFDPRQPTSPCYRCLFPDPPAAADAPNCSEAGVLGVVPGVVGLLQATEALKLLLDLGDALIGRLLTVDVLAMRFTELRLPRDPHCPGCGPDAKFTSYMDIAPICTA